jgi:hypothetical protein
VNRDANTAHGYILACPAMPPKSRKQPVNANTATLQTTT